MSRGLRIALGTISLLLFAAMIVLLARGPRFTAVGHDDLSVEVSCGSIWTIGMGGDAFINDESGGVWYDTTDASGPLPDGARDGFARDCSQRRETRLGLMIVLAVPTSLLGAAALLGRRQQIAAPPAAPREPVASA